MRTSHGFVALAAALLLAHTALAQPGALESWARAQEGPPPPIRTRVDSLTIDRSALEVAGEVASVAIRLSSWRYTEGGRAPGDSSAFVGSWSHYDANPFLDRTAEEYFLAKPGTEPASAIALREHQPRRYDRIDYRLVVTAKRLAPEKRGRPERTLVTASAQFIGFPHHDEGLLGEPIELESSGLIERDFLERLRARLAGR